MTGRPKNKPRTMFERRLRRQMKSAGISSYAGLSKKAGLSIGSVQRICSGSRKPSIETLVKLAGALSVKIENLL